MNTLQRDTTETVELTKPHPKVDAVLRMHGYKDLTKVRPKIRDMASSAAQMLTEVAAPTISYRVVGIKSLIEDELLLEEDVRLCSRVFCQYLDRAFEVIVFALTMGDEVDRKTIQLMDEDNLVEAMFLESAAWLGVENATKQFVLATREWAAQQNLRITRRLGPGYSYPINGEPVMWELTDQRNLFSVFGSSQIPIKLLESSAMLPKMSRSGMYGLIQK